VGVRFLRARQGDRSGEQVSPHVGARVCLPSGVLGGRGRASGRIHPHRTSERQHFRANYVSYVLILYIYIYIEKIFFSEVRTTIIYFRIEKILIGQTGTVDREISYLSSLRT